MTMMIKVGRGVEDELVAEQSHRDLYSHDEKKNSFESLTSSSYAVMNHSICSPREQLVARGAFHDKHRLEERSLTDLWLQLNQRKFDIRRHFFFR